MVLLVIDVQKGIVNEALYQPDVFLSSVEQLITAARANGVEVIFLRHDDGPGEAITKGAAGFEIHERVAPAAAEKVFDKRANSAFVQTGLLDYLREQGERELMITGLQTEFCVDASVKAAFEHGFSIFVPAGGNTTTDNAFMSGAQSYRYYNEWMWPGRYANCLSLQDTLRYLQQAGRKKG